MTVATFSDLVAQTYVFDVQTPDDERLSFEMRAPTQSEVWAIEREMKPRPQPPLDAKNPFKGTVAEGNLEPVYDPNDAGYLRALNDWLRELQMRRVLLCWTAEVPGDTTADKLKALDDLPNWTISALTRCTLMVITAGQVNIAGRPFRSD